MFQFFVEIFYFYVGCNIDSIGYIFLSIFTWSASPKSESFSPILLSGSGKYSPRLRCLWDWGECGGSEAASVTCNPGQGQHCSTAASPPPPPGPGPGRGPRCPPAWCRAGWICVDTLRCCGLCLGQLAASPVMVMVGWGAQYCTLYTVHSALQQLYCSVLVYTAVFCTLFTD